MNFSGNPILGYVWGDKKIFLKKIENKNSRGRVFFRGYFRAICKKFFSNYYPLYNILKSETSALAKDVFRDLSISMMESFFEIVKDFNPLHIVQVF